MGWRGGKPRSTSWSLFRGLGDDNDSIMANLDDLSSNEDAESVRDEAEARDIEMTAVLGSNGRGHGGCGTKCAEPGAGHGAG